jgi:UDPglucose 6-dehydrogenase
MKVAVVGAGYVGLVAAACLANSGNHVICVDTDKKKIVGLKKSVIPIYEPGLAEIVRRSEAKGRLHFTTELGEGVKESLVIFIAVGTPCAADGSADVSVVLEVAASIAKLMDGYRIIATKSTVPVGTHKKISEVMASKTKHPFDYVSNPEFLKEGAAVDDFMKPDRIIIGTTNPAVMEIMRQLYAPFMRKKNRMIFMDPASAELTKYAANCMLATRISFMNELSVLCEKVGADIELIRMGIGADSRIGSDFLFPGIGFGGSCFPKDVRALIHTGDLEGCPMAIARAVQDANIRQQDLFTKKILDYFKDAAGEVTLAVWGLAFKAQTNDIRESPAIKCIENLSEAGMKIKAYDPEAMPETKELLGDRIEVSENSYDILNGAYALVVLTDWQEFRNPDFERIAESLNRPVVFDGRNLYDPNYVRDRGIEYHCIGRP